MSGLCTVSSRDAFKLRVKLLLAASHSRLFDLFIAISLNFLLQTPAGCYYDEKTCFWMWCPFIGANYFRPGDSLGGKRDSLPYTDAPQPQCIMGCLWETYLHCPGYIRNFSQSQPLALRLYISQPGMICSAVTLSQKIWFEPIWTGMFIFLTNSNTINISSPCSAAGESHCLSGYGLFQKSGNSAEDKWGEEYVPSDEVVQLMFLVPPLHPLYNSRCVLFPVVILL